MKKYYNKFMNNVKARNITSLLLDITFYIGMLYTVYYVLTTAFKSLNWIYLLFLLLLTQGITMLAHRLRVINVCPICGQNRGIIKYCMPTGRTRNLGDKNTGDYIYHNRASEYKEGIVCQYCDYENTELTWHDTSTREMTEQGRFNETMKMQKQMHEEQMNMYKDIVEELRRNRYDKREL